MIKKLFTYKEPQCKVCKDTKQVEVIIMGTDTDYVECAYCSNKLEYKSFQNSLKNEHTS